MDIRVTSVYKEFEVKTKNGAGAMTTVKNEVFISLLHENVYLVERELTFSEGRNCSRCGVNEQIFG